MKKSLLALLAAIGVFLSVVVGVFIGRNTLGTTITLDPGSSNLPPATQAPGKPSALGLIDINKASKADLLMLPGIGNVKAERIIAFRETYGAYTCIEDLIFVDGFSYTLIEQLRPYITVEEYP